MEDGSSKILKTEWSANFLSGEEQNSNIKITPLN